MSKKAKLTKDDIDRIAISQADDDSAWEKPRHLHRTKGETGMEIRHYKFDRITLNPEICFGKPCVRGMRMPVASLLGYLSSGMSIKDILKSWPELEADDIYQALAYASWAMEESVLPMPGAVAG